MSERMPTYGGQAVIEGVMMRGSKAVAIAMRDPQQQIVLHEEPLGEIYRSKWVKIPFLRGGVVLWDALALGMRAITISANTQTGEDEKIEGLALYGTMALSLTLAIGLFFIIPALIGQVFQIVANGDTAAWLSAPLAFRAEIQSVSARAGWWGNLAEGIARLAILIGYIALIGRIPDIRRVFMYHGAEHKTINAFEDGAELTPETVQKYPLEHPRCGTSFLLTLVLLSVVIFSLLGPLPLEIKLVTRIVMIPVLAGIAYEYLRWTANNIDKPVVRWMVRPNLALQRLTTREPSLDQLEVAICAFNSMRSKEIVV
jgi:uncharacterized protein YqhQ